MNRTLSVVALLFMSSCSVYGMKIDKKNVVAPHELGKTKVLYNKKEFHVNGIPVERYNTSKQLRGISKKDLAQMLLAGSYLKVKELDDNKYAIDLQGRLIGGGPVGATIGCFVAKVGVSFLGHGTLLAVSFLAGPAQPAAIIALEGAFGGMIEGASMAAAVAGGIAGGVATGPV